MANRGGRFRNSSGPDQDGFSSQNQIVATSCTDTDTDIASDTDTAVPVAVIEGRDAKAIHDREDKFPARKIYILA